jgi:hypothetical protein
VVVIGVEVTFNVFSIGRRSVDCSAAASHGLVRGMEGSQDGVLV